MNLKISLSSLAILVALSSYSQVMLRYGLDPEKGWGDASSVVTPYVTFPEEFVAPYLGNEITSVRIAVMEEAANCYLYIKNKPDDQEYIYRQKLGSLTPGWNEIILETPFAISSEESIAIGYKASFTAAGGVGITSEKISDADKVYYNSQNRWTSTGGAICIIATVAGSNMPINEMLISNLREEIDDTESGHVYSGSVRNVGNNHVDSYIINISLDGETMQSIEGSDLEINGEAPFTFEINCETEGVHTVTAEITKVNGVDDFYSHNNLATASFTNQLQSFIRRIVCEEYTGTWCGFCPRGMVGLERMKEDYPDTFIPIAVHGGDPMEIIDEEVSYRPFIDSCKGAPFCNVNRQYTGDPYGDIRTIHDLASKISTHISVDATCDWNEDYTSLQLVTTYFSDIDIDKPNLNIAYTVTESGITGYLQTNYYAGGKNGEMNGWEEKSDPTLDVVFNDVARAIIGGYYGMPCQSESMTAFIPYHHSCAIPLPENITSLSQIKVVPQIIDSSNGRILNAVEVAPSAVGVKDIIDREPYVKVGICGNGISVTSSDFDNEYFVSVYGIDGKHVLSKSFIGKVAISVPKGAYLVVVRNSSKTINHTKIIL